MEHEDTTRAGYDQVADEYAATYCSELDAKPVDQAPLRVVAEQAHQGPIADVGCGPGHVTRHLRELGRDVLGIDLSPRMILVAREWTPEASFQVGSMLALDAPDGGWGGLVALYSIIHLDPRELSRACAEFHRVLAPGGLLLVSFHSTPPAEVEVRGDAVHVDEYLGRPGLPRLPLLPSRPGGQAARGRRTRGRGGHGAAALPGRGPDTSLLRAGRQAIAASVKPRAAGIAACEGAQAVEVPSNGLTSLVICSTARSPCATPG